jgi:hypothetical protein
MQHTPGRRPAGEAYIEVKDDEGRQRAMTRHKGMMGSRYIEVFASTKADMLQVWPRTAGGAGQATRGGAAGVRALNP